MVKYSAPAHHSSDDVPESRLPENEPQESSPLSLRLAGSPVLPFGMLSAVGLPPGVSWANRFSLLNAVSWSLVLGSPLILYAKSIGCGDAILGILAAIPPLLVVLQIPGAYLLPRFGYRRVMVSGWAARTVFIFTLAVSVLWPSTDLAKVAWLLISIGVFSIFRSITGGAYMPWVTSLVPPDVRGKFFTRDQLFGQAGNVISLLVAAACLLGNPQPWQFALVFFLAGAGGFASLLCLVRLPEISNPEAHAHSGARVDLAEMLCQRSFRRLGIFNVVYSLVWGALGVFTIAFLRQTEGLAQSAIVLLSSASVFGGLVSLLWSGVVIDRIGSRPIMTVCVLASLVIFLGWWALAAEVVALNPIYIGTLYLLMGMSALNFAAANNRLQSLNIPHHGRNHYFAVFAVATSAAAGLSPLVWGLILESIGKHHSHGGPVVWNRYSIFFACGCLLCLPLLALTRGLEDHFHPGASPQSATP